MSQGPGTSEGTTPAQTLGERLRIVRRQRGISVRKLAAEVGCSPSHVSQFERGISEPSISLLTALVDVLDVTMDSLFSKQDAPPVTTPAHLEASIVRRSHLRPEIKIGRGVRSQLLLPAEEDGVDFCEYVYEPGTGSPTASGALSHPGREYGVVIEGTIDVEFGDQCVTLREGDSVAFDSATPHRFHNRSRAPARMIWFSASRL
ncbi:helix-turn-helix domain-containing protein [Mycolicibacterium baixiangningiae]|uniref:helix-turn-helix domain-containing protein n=1 Tax=Mycolicibacterium baixiangningiae TaxID=2761578 RepID=UPI001865E5A0|nr:cupin domain-containing protein [Mycolicibacterium baixiangningiae]